MPNLVESQFLNCSVASASLSIGLGQSPTSLNLELIEPISSGEADTSPPYGNWNFAGYTGSLGVIYSGTIGGNIDFIGLLENHSIKLGANGRSISATLTDGRNLLKNIQILTGKQYGAEGIYSNCNTSINILNAMRQLEPGVSSQFYDPLNISANDTLIDFYATEEGCSNSATDKCHPTLGFMSSGRDKHGIPSSNLIGMFISSNQVLNLPMSNQTVKINLQNLYDLAFLNETKGKFSIINDTSINVLDLIQNVCEDIGADFTVRLDAGVAGVSDYQLVVDVVDRSYNPSEYSLRDFVKENYLDTNLSTEISYGQEATNEPTRKVVLGDYYRYFVEIAAPSYPSEANGWVWEHEQRSIFGSQWNNGFGNYNITSDDNPVAITGIVDNYDDMVDPAPGPFTSQDVYSSGGPHVVGSGSGILQTSAVDLQPIDKFPADYSGLPADFMPLDCHHITNHRIFQILREETVQAPSNTNIRFPPVQKVYLTRFAADGNSSGFQVDWDLPARELLDTLNLDSNQQERLETVAGFSSPILTHEELLASSNFECYKTWITNHKRSVGYWCGLSLVENWSELSAHVVFNGYYDWVNGGNAPADYPVLTDRIKKQLEFVQLHIKKIYDDYYGKEFAVLLDRKLLAHVINNLDTHDVCFASSFNASLAHAVVNNQASINTKIIPPYFISNLKEGYIYGHRISGDEENFETSDHVVDGAWPAGPDQTGVLDVPVSGLSNFQNSDGTIAGFVNLGSNIQCRKLGSLWGKYKFDLSSMDFNELLWNNDQLYAKASFDPQMLLARLDDNNILPYEGGGDCVLVRFSIPKINLLQNAVIVEGDEIEYNASDVFSVADSLYSGSGVNDSTVVQLTPKEKSDGAKAARDKEKTANDEPVYFTNTDGAQGSTETIKYKIFNPLAAIPSEVAIPFQSRTQVYGPFSVTSNPSGATEIVDSDLAPWQFVSNLENANIITYSWVNGMVAAGQQMALDGLRTRSFQETATVGYAGIPAIDLTKGITLGQGNSLGAVLDGINITYGANGASTNFSFSSYSRKFGQSESFVRNAVQNLVNDRRQTEERLRREKNQRRNLSFSNSYSIGDPKIHTAKNTTAGKEPVNPGSENPASAPNNNASDGSRGGGGQLLYSHYGFGSGVFASGTGIVGVHVNSTGGQTIVASGNINSIIDDDIDSDPISISIKPPSGNSGNLITKTVHTSLNSVYSEDHNQPYYRNIAITSIDSLFLPVSIDGGLPGSGSGNLSSFVLTLDTCITGMRNRPHSSIPPIKISSIKEDKTFFDLQICSSYLNPYISKKQLESLDDRDDGSTKGFNISKISVTESGNYFLTGDKRYSVDASGNQVIEFDRQDEVDFRFNAIRGPLVLQGWGYDTDGKPIPNGNDSAQDCEQGKFRNNGLKDKFLKNWLDNPKTWPVAPIDLRFDRNRGVWVAPTQNKVLLARMKEAIGEFGQAEAELINLEAGDEGKKKAYYANTNLWGPNGEDISQDVRNATVTVYDYIQLNLKKGDLVYLYYDDGKYIVMNQAVAGGGAVFAAKTLGAAGTGGTFKAELVDSSSNFEITNDTAKEVTVTDYLNKIPFSIPQDTPITISDIGEANSVLISIGVPKGSVGYNGSVFGLNFDDLPVTSEVPTYFLGMNGSNIVRYQGVTTCDSVLS